eukprot:GEMP01030007.1.p1 GENE.GEMP01030007.1~~GEMP01030007.1.p1  ORF type:complete len:357 (+),score=50.09 GEMP01030007.1:39-1109(+)
MGLGKLSERYADLWKAIIRPPRDDYTFEDLGPQVFHLAGRTYTRKDVQLRNPRGLTLECSHFEPLLNERPQECLPCVIYMHGNCSSRFEALVTLPILLPHNMTLFCFDFAGSGMSEGHYVSLGYYEKDDLAAVVEYLRGAGSVSTIGLWGRSMGAATALLHAHRDLSIGAMVLDSPFTDLRTLAKELVDTYVNFKVKIPKFLISVVLGWLRVSIKREAKFDISDLNPVQYVSKSFIPALFVAGKGDSFIKPHHTQTLYEQYAGDKNLVLVEGDHNTSRPRFCMDGAGFFFYRWLLADQIHTNTDRIQRTPAPLHLSSCSPTPNTSVNTPYRHREAVAAPCGNGAAYALLEEDDASL